MSETKLETKDKNLQDLIKLTSQLINERSISPETGNCFKIIQAFCQSIGCQWQRLDHGKTSNLFITSQPVKSFEFLFSGHIDVVPPGDLDLWTSPPFQAQIRNETLYGRGACDMKSSVASMLMALKNVIQDPSYHAPIAVLLTSDEEDIAIDGTQFAMQKLKSLGFQFQYALVGEPTSAQKLGDTMKNGRRGSLSGSIKIHGKQSHVAYQIPGENPIFAMANFIHKAHNRNWDDHHPHFPKTQFCVTQIETPSNASNVTPNYAKCYLNFRYNPSSSAESLKHQVNLLLESQPLKYICSWLPENKPFYKTPGKFSKLIHDSVFQSLSVSPILSTSGGTSDARFVSQYVEEVIEFGPLNQSAHAIDEHIQVKDLHKLYLTYKQILRNLNLIHSRKHDEKFLCSHL